MKCRHCHTHLVHRFLDLGTAPPSNAYLNSPDQPETRLPLKLFVCDQCWLVQTEDFASAQSLFTGDYAYFSSISQSWLDHAAHYAAMIIKKLSLNKNSHVVEIASNDGYLLKNFVAAGIPCLGIEPTASTASAAEKLGIPVLRDFFGEALAHTMQKADLIIGNNVYAHVPDINDFTKGLKVLLKPGGTITLEFPHLLQLIGQRQFDTVYHEHFSYFSLYTVNRIFQSTGLRVYAVEELSTHGGSLRVYGCHDSDPRPSQSSVVSLLDKEKTFGLQSLNIYRNFQPQVEAIKTAFLAFLTENKGKKIAAYGAAAKGNTLLNFCGVTSEQIAYVCDAAPSKQGKFLPGSRIPIVPPAELRARKPDIVIILPWNIATEVILQHNYIKQWSGRLVTVVPELKNW